MSIDGHDPFSVPGAEWSRVSPGLVTLRRMELLVVVMVVLAGVGTAWVIVESQRLLAAIAAASVLAAAGCFWWLVERQVSAWGWVERDADLIITRGRWWRRLDVVPYGRMQLVDVTAGPLQRAFGLTTVRMHTASPSSRAHLPGLPPEVARRLRDRLSQRGEALAAGL